MSPFFYALARLLAGPVRLRPAVAVHRVEVRLGVPRGVVPPLPARVLRQVELLAVHGQVAEVQLHVRAEPGDVEQPEEVELRRGFTYRLVLPDDVGRLLVEPERDAAVAFAGVGALPPPVPVVPLEVLDEALVADREQPPVQLLARESRLLPLQPLEDVLLPLELVRLAVPRAIRDVSLQGLVVPGRIGPRLGLVAEAPGVDLRAGREQDGGLRPPGLPVGGHPVEHHLAEAVLLPDAKGHGVPDPPGVPAGVEEAHVAHAAEPDVAQGHLARGGELVVEGQRPPERQRVVGLDPRVLDAPADLARAAGEAGPSPAEVL